MPHSTISEMSSRTQAPHRQQPYGSMIPSSPVDAQRISTGLWGVTYALGVPSGAYPYWSSSACYCAVGCTAGRHSGDAAAGWTSLYDSTLLSQRGQGPIEPVTPGDGEAMTLEALARDAQKADGRSHWHLLMPAVEARRLPLWVIQTQDRGVPRATAGGRR